MDGRNHHDRVWLSEIHQIWHEYVREHPQHRRFAPLPKVVTKSRGRR